MDSFQLRYALVKAIKGHVGVCAINQLKSINFNSFSIICNNEPDTEVGMHWLAFYKDESSECVEFFDSFAMPIDFYGEEFSKFCTRKGKILQTSKVQLQSNQSSLCGNYCLYFLIHRSRGVSFTNILNQFSENLHDNDRIVKNFVQNHFKFPHFSKCQEYCASHCLQGIDSVCVQKTHQCYKLDREGLKKCQQI